MPDEDRPPLNGFPLVSQLKRDDGIVIVLVDRGETVTDRYVTACVRDVSDPTWWDGHYHVHLDVARQTLVHRAGLVDMTSSRYV